MDTKEKIRLSAYKLFVEHGFHNTSMQNLMHETQLSKGAFYHYFKSKEAIYNEVVEHYFLSFYKAVNWNTYQDKNLTICDIEKGIHKFYMNFAPKILQITNKGFSRYFIMYFEAYDLHSGFKTEVQKFYKNLEQLLINATDNIERSASLATSVIAKYEGILFLLAINPGLNIESLLKTISSCD